MITPTTFLVCKFLFRQIIRLPRIISVEFLLATSGSLLHHGLIYKVKVVTKSAFWLKLTICSSGLPYFLIFRIVILATEHIHILVKTGQIILLYNRILELWLRECIGNIILAAISWDWIIVLVNWLPFYVLGNLDMLELFNILYFQFLNKLLGQIIHFLHEH